MLCLLYVVSTINGQRLAAGKGPVGFINPTLYANPKAFNDITVGDIKCTTTDTCCLSGFVAANGWDPATGLGSVKFANLQKIFINVSTSANLYFAPSLSPAYVLPTTPTTTASNSRINATLIYIIIGSVLAGFVVLWFCYIFIRSQFLVSGNNGNNNAGVGVASAPIETVASFSSSSHSTIATATPVQRQRPDYLQSTSFGVANGTTSKAHPVYEM